MELPKKRYTSLTALGLLVRIVPGAMTVTAVQQIYSGLRASLNLLATASFIDRALAVVAGKAELWSVWLPLAAIIGLMALDRLSGAVLDLCLTRSHQKRNRILNLAVRDKISRLHYCHIEDDVSADLVNRVVEKTAPGLWNVFTTLASIVSMTVNVVGILTILAAQVWWAALVLLGSCMPVFFFTYRHSKRLYDARRENERLYRRKNYFERVLTDRETVEERSLFGYTDAINGVWYEASMQAWRQTVKLQIRDWIGAKTSSVFSVVAAGLIAASLIVPTMAGKISTGMFISLVTACFNLRNAFSWRLVEMLGSIVENREFLKDLTAFVALEETVGAADAPAKVLPPFERLEFRNVCFTYPGTDRPILNGLSLTVEAGRQYAIVGANGAGKTTLAKLLCGLYDNYSGEILLNGRELREYPYAVRKGMFASVFQDFARYQLTVAENVRLGNLQAADGAVREAVETVGLAEVIGKLPQGLDTPLGKIKAGGQDLSGGEWQRVAMARTLASRASLYLLDEPTSALDPIAESKLYEEFATISRGKATIFISHRLGSTRLADEIFVLENGRVAESGTHEALMAREGLFAEMFASQRSWYE